MNGRAAVCCWFLFSSLLFLGTPQEIFLFFLFSSFFAAGVACAGLMQERATRMWMSTSGHLLVKRLAYQEDTFRMGARGSIVLW